MTSYRDWVVETSSTTGTGAYALSGSAPAGTSYFTFRQRYANGEDKVVYWVVSANRQKWEKNRFGTLTYGSPDSLSRNVVESTNGDAPVSWIGDDLPLRLYCVPDAEAMEFAITMGFGATRPEVLKNGFWAKEDGVSADVDELQYFDGTNDIPFANVDRTSHALLLKPEVVGAHKVVRVQVFTGSGTYTPDPNLITADIMALAGGGGGGGCADAAASTGVIAGGGGAGSWSRNIVTADQVGASLTVTIGAAGTGGAAGDNAGGNGGDTLVGGLCIGGGGQGGAGIAGTADSALGGLGGVQGTGSVKTTGAPGQGGTTHTNQQIEGAGASSPYGGGGRAKVSIVAAAGEAATGFGAGGGGATSRNAGGARAGGNGSAGLAVIIEYCSE